MQYIRYSVFFSLVAGVVGARGVRTDLRIWADTRAFNLSLHPRPRGLGTVITLDCKTGSMTLHCVSLCLPSGSLLGVIK